jgi:hypothetical protein
VATARERLIQALMVIISQPFSDDGMAALNRLLNSYRVQTKPGEHVAKDQTARDDLANKIVDAWKNNALGDKKLINNIISSFRMQLKQGLSRGRVLEPRPTVGDQNPSDSNNKSMPRSKIKENAAVHENAYFKNTPDSGKKIVETGAIAGGPKQSSNTRGQCPKCRSIGIVLARAYGGDDYHSCIYCGYQAYLKDADANLDLPLAAGLLNALKEPKVDDED